MATLLSVALYLLGALRSPFAGYDEAGHLVSGIMVYQYLHALTSAPVDPKSFAENFYDHYPRVSIGHWPPLFYVMQGMWFAIVGLSRHSVVALTVFIAVAIGLFTALLCRLQGLSWPLAATASVVAVLMPQAVRSTLEFSLDPLVAFAILTAAFAAQRWLSHQTLRLGILFALLGSCAVLIKGNAFVLYLLPLLAFPFRTATLRSFWLPILLLVSLPLPWYVFTREHAVAEILPGVTNSLTARILYSARINALGLFSIAGPLLPLFAVASHFSSRWVRPWPVLYALPFAFWVFLSALSPHTENRHMLAVIPVLCLSAAIAIRHLHPALGSASLLVGLAAGYWVQPVQPKPPSGFVEAVAWARHLPVGNLLVASNDSGEGAWISELALYEPMPRFKIVRASKFLYRAARTSHLTDSPADVLNLLRSQNLRYVVIHHEPAQPSLPYHQMLERSLQGWPLAASFDRIKIYQSPS